MKENPRALVRVLTTLALVTGACTTSVKPSDPKPTFEPPKDIPTLPIFPTETDIPAPTSTPEPSPTPENPGIAFHGYWLDVTKTNDGGSWKMELKLQDGLSSEVVATFCVRGSDNNTPNGVYFVLTDRGTTYPHAPGYADTFFPHNYAFKFAKSSWYLHPAPWNDKGQNGCPVKSSGGCVNMRPEDFDVIINGGPYQDPVKNQNVEIPHLGIGTPMVITDEGNSCDLLGDCMKKLNCMTGYNCFRIYSCQYCVDSGTKWENLEEVKPELYELDSVRKP